MDNNHFCQLLLTEILANITNQYDDNYDERRFGRKPRLRYSWKTKLRNIIEAGLKNTSFSLVDASGKHAWDDLSPYFDDLVLLHQLLSDESSKRLLVQLVAYRILGHRKYKLPLNMPDYWNGIKRIDRLKNEKDHLTVNFPGGAIFLYKFNLNERNIPLEIYYTAGGIYHDLEVKQYEYITGEVCIKPEIGDIILDCGGCWGTTALFFANAIKGEGQVYSFEFVPGNIAVFTRNLGLNPHLKEHIALIPNPLDDQSDKDLFYKDNGPGTRVFSQSFPDAKVVSSISIDDFYDQHGLKRVDFIKMDIEGTELRALKGAARVIRRFRPKLAVAIYHSMNDFVGISKYIDSLNLGYQFYLKHGTIHKEETVLIAAVPERNVFKVSVQPDDGTGASRKHDDPQSFKEAGF